MEQYNSFEQEQKEIDKEHEACDLLVKGSLTDWKTAYAKLDEKTIELTAQLIDDLKDKYKKK